MEGGKCNLQQPLCKNWEENCLLLLLLMCLFPGNMFSRKSKNTMNQVKSKFFLRNIKLLGLNRQIGQINVGAFGVFLVNLSAPILVLRVPCPCFPYNQPLFLRKTKPFRIPQIYLGLGFEFEFGPKRIYPLCVRSPCHQE